MRDRYIIGIDPGATGAIALLKPDNAVGVCDLPTAMTDGFNGIDANAFAEIVRMIVDEAGTPAAVLACCEKAIINPKNGSKALRSVFDCRGVIRAVLALEKVALVYIPAPSWKKYHGLIGKEKEHSRGLALQLFPDCAALLQRKKDHNRAEALLIASYAGNRNLD